MRIIFALSFCLCPAGAQHLGGQNGVLNLLTERGYLLDGSRP